jgi:hypothetical protein
MSALPEITIDELLAENEKAKLQHNSDGWLTVSEMAKTSKIRDVKIRSILKVAQQEGRLECQRQSRITITGSLQSVPVFRIKPSKAPRKSKRK